MKYGLILLLTLAGCFAMQSLLMRVLGPATLGGVSSYFLALGRMQDGTRGNPEVMLLGSSRTGRLPAESCGVPGVANLGCDGASAVVCLRMISDGQITPAPVVLIEGNTLFKAVEEPRPPLVDGLESPWYGIGRRVPLLGASARPSAMIYGSLYSRVIRGRGEQQPESPSLRTLPATLDPDFPIALSKPEERLVVELVGIIDGLLARDVEVMIYDLPPAAPEDSPNVRVAMEVARRAGVPYWDLNHAFPGSSLGLTDGVHLNASSATWVLQGLLEQAGRR